MNPQTSWQFWALGSAIFAAITAITAKIGVKGVDSDLATAIRTVVIGIFAWAIVWHGGASGEIGKIGQRTWLFLIVSGLATGASWLCYFRALQLGPASRVAPVDKLSVVFVIVLAALFLGETLTWRAALGGGFIALGAWILAT